MKCSVIGFKNWRCISTLWWWWWRRHHHYHYHHRTATTYIVTSRTSKFLPTVSQYPVRANLSSTCPAAVVSGRFEGHTSGETT